MLIAAVSAMMLAPAEFRAMTFNIWVGGTRHQPLSQTVRAIEAARADVVGIQEPGENLGEIAAGLGWNYSQKASVVTRFQILEEWKTEGNRWGGVRLKLPSGEQVLFYNDHFNAYPYGPYEIRDGKAKDEAGAIQVEIDSGRVGQMERVLANISERPERELPVVFTGDFNTPSHLDWVQGGVGRTFGLKVRWPVTVLAEKAGFRDAYREVYPDALKRPGYTWSPGYPVPEIAADDVLDRIDFVIFRGGLKVKSAEVVAEKGPHTDIAVDPWPSDHRAVVVQFAVGK